MVCRPLSVIAALAVMICCTAAWAETDIVSIMKADPFDPKRGEGRVIETPSGIEKSEGVQRRWILYGLVVAGGVREAYIGLRAEAKKRGRQYRVVRVGDLVDGWQVVEIGEREVRLSSKGKDVVLRLFEADHPGRSLDIPVATVLPRPEPIRREQAKPAAAEEKAGSRVVSGKKGVKPAVEKKSKPNTKPASSRPPVSQSLPVRALSKPQER